LPEIALEMKNITKRFPLVVANDNVNFKVYKGEIHALVGENGAGKSTLMSILYGLYQADSGKIFIKDWYGSSAFYVSTTFNRYGKYYTGNGAQKK